MHCKNVKLSTYILMKYLQFYPGESSKNRVFLFFPSPTSPHSVAETSTQETEHYTQRVGELRFISPAGSVELTLQTLSPEQRGYGVFVHKQAWLSTFAGVGQLQRAGQGWDKLQTLVLWVPTFWDLRDSDFARSKLSYRGRRSRRVCKFLTLQFHPLKQNFHQPHILHVLLSICFSF